jgi:1,4-dihydroxy-6-naphthoate synthase
MNMETRPLLTIGFSPCPNDTFVFHAMVHGEVDLGGAFVMPLIDDVETLNLRLITGVEAPALCKLSVGALGRVLNVYRPIDVGAALGRGVGPLVVGRQGHGLSLASLANKRVLTPGENTTAHALLRMFAPEAETRSVRYDRIMAEVAAGRADAGVIIHEGRFTFEAAGLEAVEDLGSVWEQETGLPLPLGVLAVRRDLTPELAQTLERGVASSLAQARANPDASWAWIREHAQEMDEDVCRRHIALYVNEFTTELGAEGRGAIEQFIARSRAVGLIPDGPPAFS